MARSSCWGYRKQTRSNRLLNLVAIPANMALGWLHTRRRPYRPEGFASPEPPVWSAVVELRKVSGGGLLNDTIDGS